MDILTRNVTNSKLLNLCFSNITFCCCYGIFLFLYELKFMREWIYQFHPIFLVWGSCIIVINFLIKGQHKHFPHRFVFSLFCISAIITSILTYESGIITNLKVLVLMIFPILIIFPACWESRNKELACIKAMSGAAVVVFFASLISIVMFLLRIRVIVTFFGIEELIGIQYYYPNDPTSAVILYGIYQDTNHAAAYAIIMIIYSILLLDVCKKNIIKGKVIKHIGKSFAFSNIVVQCCYFPLANSRGGYLALFITVIIGCALYIFNVKKITLNLFYKFMMFSLVAVVSLLIVYGGLVGLRSCLSSASYPISNYFDIESNIDQNEQQDSFSKNNSNFGAGRILIWKDTWELCKEKPLFGTGPNYPYYCQKYNISTTLLGMGKAVHNSYLELLLYYGFMGSILLLLYWGLCIKDIVLWTIYHNQIKIKDLMMILGVVFTLGISFLLSCAFINVTAMYYTMILMLGCSFPNQELYKFTTNNGIISIGRKNCEK